MDVSSFKRFPVSAARCMCAVLLLTSCSSDSVWSAAKVLQWASALQSLIPQHPVLLSQAGPRPSPRPAPAPALNPPPSTTKSKTPYGQNAKNFELSFTEEFDRYNSRVWNDHIWYEKSNPTKNYTVENGLLKIWPQRDSSGKFFNRTFDTDGKFTQTYGYFEMEAKLPKGKGTWPAFWLFAHPGSRRPEIDIMEAYPGGEGWGQTDSAGIPRPTVYAQTVWLDEGVQAGFKMFPTGVDLSAGFHKYAVKWERDKQTFYFNGKEVQTVTASMSDPMYIVLDLWFGGASGTPDDTTPQGKFNSFEVNYVRAWRIR